MTDRATDRSRFDRRSRAIDEWMDHPDADPALLAQSLVYLRRINRLLGYVRSTIKHLESLTRSLPHDRPLTVLDVGTGGADLPEALCRWADRRGRAIRVIGLDLHARTLTAARRSLVDSRIALLRGDALDLPMPDRSVDVAMCSLFLHHLDDAQVVQALREMRRVARVGLVAGDLLRHRRAYLWIKLLTLTANPMVRHDAPISVLQSFRSPEIVALARQAGLPSPALHRHFGHRFVLVSRW
ncbi:MAG TPA: methyltransferase domain-containing protein [Tepidisphaeraceae bacterium]|nr:methyltransferase domain-containing protein [Tepidisphaeraceae bacterium]